MRRIRNKQCQRKGPGSFFTLVVSYVTLDSVKQQSIRKDKKDAIVNDDNSEWMEKYRVAEKCYMFIKVEKFIRIQSAIGSDQILL